MLITAQKVVLILFCLLPLRLAAADFPPPGFKEVNSAESPQGTFKVVHYQRNPEDFSSDSQIWLQASKPEFKTQLLFTHNNSATVLVSPDENLIAINHHVMSGLGGLQLFSRGKDGLYHEREKDLLGAAHKLMLSQLGLAAKTELDHEACFADLWLRDGVLLSHLVGNESGVSELAPWYFVYDVQHDRFSEDLSRLNQGAFRYYRHSKAP